ncbi:MAG: tail-specific protease, partial [Flavobacteriia bacterium]|nr:tail-specific protease [Flavobacteriia bacterium]
MKKNLKYTLPALFLVAAVALSFAWKAPSDDQEKVVMLLVHDALTGVHYQAKDIDDAFSHEVLEFFLESMDAEKRFLQQSDIDQMRVYDTRMDDLLKNADLSFFNL